MQILTNISEIHGRSCFGGWGINLEIWEVLFPDKGGAELGGINFETWEVLFRDMGVLFRDLGGAELGGGIWEAGTLPKMVWWPSGYSVPDSELSVPCSNLGPCSHLGPCGDFISGNVNHEQVRDMRTAQCSNGEGNWGCCRLITKNSEIC